MIKDLKMNEKSEEFNPDSEEDDYNDIYLKGEPSENCYETNDDAILLSMNDYFTRIQNQSDSLLKDLEECDVLMEEANSKMISKDEEDDEELKRHKDIIKYLEEEDERELKELRRDENSDGSQFFATEVSIVEEKEDDKEENKLNENSGELILATDIEKLERDLQEKIIEFNKKSIEKEKERKKIEENILKPLKEIEERKAVLREEKRALIEDEKLNLIEINKKLEEDNEKENESLLERLTQSQKKYEEKIEKLGKIHANEYEEFNKQVEFEKEKRASKQNKAAISIQAGFRRYCARKIYGQAIDEKRRDVRNNYEQKRIAEIDERKREERVKKEKQAEEERIRLQKVQLEEAEKLRKEEERLEKIRQEEEHLRLEKLKQEEMKKKEEAKKRQEEEERKRQEEEKKKQEAEKIRLEEEKRQEEEKKRQEEEKIRLEEEKRKEEEKKRQEEEKRRKEEEKKRQEEEKKRQDEEKKRQEEEKKNQEEEKKRQEEEKRIQEQERLRVKKIQDEEEKKKQEAERKTFQQLKMTAGDENEDMEKRITPEELPTDKEILRLEKINKELNEIRKRKTKTTTFDETQEKRTAGLSEKDLAELEEVDNRYDKIAKVLYLIREDKTDKTEKTVYDKNLESKVLTTYGKNKFEESLNQYAPVPKPPPDSPSNGRSNLNQRLNEKQMEKKNTAAIKIQSLWRGYKARQNFDTYIKRCLAAITIQQAWRSYKYANEYDLYMHNAAILIQKTWRGYRVRKKLDNAKQLFLKSDIIKEASESEESDEEEIDFNFNEDSIDIVIRPSDVPDLQNDIALPPLSTADSSNQPPNKPVEAWRASPLNNSRMKPPLPPLHSRASSRTGDPDISTQRTFASKKEEELQQEWGFKNSQTAALMLERAKKMKYNSERRKKISKLDAKQRLALFKKFEGEKPSVQAVKKGVQRTEYFQGVQKNFEKEEKTKILENSSKDNRTYEWIHTQVSNFDISLNSSRINQSENLPKLDNRVLSGGRSYLTESPVSMELQSVGDSSVSGTRRFSATDFKPRKGSLPSIKTTNSAPHQKSNEKLSWRNKQVKLSGGWGGGKKRGK